MRKDNFYNRKKLNKLYNGFDLKGFISLSGVTWGAREIGQL